MQAPMNDMAGFTCSGKPLGVGGGTLRGHVIPGLLFLTWGLYWAQASFRRHISSQHSNKPYSSKSWYPCNLAGRWLYCLEPFLKCLAAPIGLSIELYFDSHDGFRSLYCSDTGRFSQQYVHNYQHAASYPAVFVSGFVDFVGLFIPLPEGTQQVFLAMAFGIQGFLMLVHKKHTPLDAEVHLLLGYAMACAAVAIILELRFHQNFMLSAFRAFSLCLQGAWMIVMGEMLFTGSKAWNDDYMGPAMMAPPAFAMLVLATSLALLLLYAALDAWHRRRQVYTSLPLSNVVAETRDPEVFGVGIDDDSAHASSSSDDGRDSMDSHGKPAKQRYQLATALGKLKSGLPHAKHSASKSSEHIV